MPGMNMITALLGVTAVLLVAVLGFSFKAMKDDSDPKELANLKAELEALKVEQERRPAPVMPPIGVYTPPAPVVPPTPPFNPTPEVVTPVPPDKGTPGTPDSVVGTPEETPLVTPGAEPINPVKPISTPKDTNESVEAELAAKEAQIARLTKANQMLKDEQQILARPMIEVDRRQAARAKLIKQSLLQGRVTKWEGKQLFGIMEIHRPEVQEGSILAIRRKTGIYGKVEVTKIHPGNRAAIDPIRGTFPTDVKSIKLLPGDDLIVAPIGDISIEPRN